VIDELVLEKPAIELVIRETGWDYWASTFERWHYLKLGPMPFSTAYVGFVDDQPVCHLGVSGMVAGGRRCARACRMVVLPEWMSAGVGTSFLDYMAERELQGEGFIGKPVPTYFHTNHPALAFVLRRSPKWRQVSSKLYGDRGSGESLTWGHHLRGVQGFKYFGQAGIDALKEAT
jgi:GNAT superfamily N-acetyltransferase